MRDPSLKKQKYNLKVSQVGMKDDLKAIIESLLGQQVGKIPDGMGNLVTMFPVWKWDDPGKSHQ